MATQQRQRRMKKFSGAIGASVAAALVPLAHAAQYVYTPAGTTDQWSAGTNWTAAPVSAADTQLTIVGNNATVIPAVQVSSANNDNGGNFQLNILDLQGTGPLSGTAPSISLTGNALELIANGATNPVINLNAVGGPVEIVYTVGNNLVLTNNTTLTGNGNSGFTFAGGISGGGSLTKSGTSTALLTGSNSYAGGTTVSGGILRTAQAASLPGYNSLGQVVVNSGGTLGVIAGGGVQWTDAEIATLLSNATFNGGSGLGIQVDSGNTLSYGSNITNPVALTKSGAGTLILSGTNNYSGGTTISGGILSVGDAAHFSGASSALNIAGGVLQVTGTTLNNLNGNTINTSSFNGGFDIVEAGNTFTFSQSISGTGGLSKAGAGTLILSGTNTHSGATSLSNGTLVVTDGTQLGSGNLNLGNASFPSTLQITGSSATINSPIIPMDGNGGAPVSVSAAGSVDFTGVMKATEANAVLNINSVGTTTFSGQVHTSDNSAARNLRIGGSGNVLISGVVSNGTAGATTGGLGYTGTGKLTLGGTNTFAGTTFVTNGTVSITNGSQLGTSRIQWGEGTTTTSPTLEVTGVGPISISNGINIRTGTTAPGILSAATPLNFTGAMSATTGTAVLLINNSSPTTFSGTVPISDGASNRTIRLGGSGDIHISGTVSNTATSGGVGSLFYTGIGTLTLSGNNTHTGVTTLNTGTLSISSASAFGGNGRVDLGSNGAGSAATTFQITGSGPITIPNQVFVRGSTGTAVTMQAARPVNFSGTFSSATTGVINFDNSSLTTLSGNVQISDNGSSNRTLRIGGNGNVLISGNVTSGGSTTSNLAYDGTATLTIDGSISHTGSTSATSGKLLLNNSLTTSSSLSASGSGTVELASNGTFLRLIRTPSVNASGTGKVDLTDNKLIVTGGDDLGSWNGSAYTGVTGLIQTGRGDGSWNGSGIVTSMTDATTGVLTTLAVASAEELGNVGGTFAGETVNAGDTLVMYTWGGDADLNGELNGDDYFYIDSNVINSGSVFGFHQGDFDYNGEINGDDYFIIDSNITFAQANGFIFPTSSSAGGGGLAAVPEPASLGLISLCMTLASRRRRRA